MRIKMNEGRTMVKTIDLDTDIFDAYDVFERLVASNEHLGEDFDDELQEDLNKIEKADIKELEEELNWTLKSWLSKHDMDAYEFEIVSE